MRKIPWSEYYNFWNQWKTGFSGGHEELSSFAEYCNVQPDEMVLEIGIGGGDVNINTANYFVGDLNFNAVSHQKNKNPDLKLVQFDGRYIPFKDKCFDKVLVRYLIHNIPNENDRFTLFRDVQRVLKPKGLMVLGRVPDKTAGRLCFAKYLHLTSIKSWVLCRKEYFYPLSIGRLTRRLSLIGFDLVGSRKMPENTLYRDLIYENRRGC